MSKINFERDMKTLSRKLKAMTGISVLSIANDSTVSADFFKDENGVILHRAYRVEVGANLSPRSRLRRYKIFYAQPIPDFDALAGLIYKFVFPA